MFSFSLGSDVTRVVARAKTSVNDGHWHTVTVDYFNKVLGIVKSWWNFYCLLWCYKGFNFVQLSSTDLVC